MSCLWNANGFSCIFISVETRKEAELKDPVFKPPNLLPPLAPPAATDKDLLPPPAPLAAAKKDLLPPPVVPAAEKDLLPPPPVPAADKDLLPPPAVPAAAEKNGNVDSSKKENLTSVAVNKEIVKSIPSLPYTGVCATVY